MQKFKKRINGSGNRNVMFLNDVIVPLVNTFCCALTSLSESLLEPAAFMYAFVRGEVAKVKMVGASSF